MSFLTVFAFLRFDHGARALIANCGGQDRWAPGFCSGQRRKLDPNNLKMVMLEYPRMGFCVDHNLVKPLNMNYNSYIYQSII